MAKTTEWTCPICNSKNTVETSSGFEDMCAYSHMRCEDCGAEWEDNFSVEYCGYNIHTEDGDTIIYDAKGERDMTAFEELKAWCEKHLEPREYKVVPETESYRATVYFDNSGLQAYICFRDGLYAGAGETDNASMREHINEYERDNA